MNYESFRLESMEYTEWIGKRLNWKIKKFPLGELNLLLGDNAQGKTRLFNVINFIHGLHAGTRTVANPDFRGRCNMWFSAGSDEIVYNLKMRGKSVGAGLVFSEVVTRNGEVLFDRSKRIMIEEESGRCLEKFFLPEHLPAVSSIENTRDFITLNGLKDYLQRMLFLKANRFAAANIEVDADAMILNAKGSNISCVLANWQRKMPSVYKEIVDTFRDTFPFITKISIQEESVARTGIRAPMLIMKERNLGITVNQTEWSDGLLRAICQIALVCTQFRNSDDHVVRPSLIVVDEVENGLDFNTLAKVVSHYHSYSNIVQTFISTHSPLVCNMIHPKHWLLAKRKRATVQIFRPDHVEDIDSVRSVLKKDNWEFYRRHLARSKLYVVR